MNSTVAGRAKRSLCFDAVIAGCRALRTREDGYPHNRPAHWVPRHHLRTPFWVGWLAAAAVGTAVEAPWNWCETQVVEMHSSRFWIGVHNCFICTSTRTIRDLRLTRVARHCLQRVERTSPRRRKFRSLKGTLRWNRTKSPPVNACLSAHLFCTIDRTCSRHTRVGRGSITGTGLVIQPVFPLVVPLVGWRTLVKRVGTLNARNGGLK